MTEVQKLARFVTGTRFGDLSDAALAQLRIRVLDTIGVAIAALDAEPTMAIRGLTERLGGNGEATLIGGGRSAPDRAAFHNTALSRYLDFMDSYLAAGETNHPSDNLGAILAAAESAWADGRTFLTALACAYQVHTRLSDVAPVRGHGFDHTVQGAYAVAAGVARALGLTPEQTANAIAIAGTANNALRVTRTGELSHWKGLAYPQVAKEGTFAALLARAGITGPAQVFEGNKGFKQTIAGDFDIDWAAEDLESVRRTIVKKHNAEIHSQSALDAAIRITGRPGFDPAAIREVAVTTFQVAYDIIGGGEEGDKRRIHTKEEADHSLPYMVAVALLDGEVQPDQYAPARIRRDDVQQLLQRVTVRPDPDYSARFPAEMPSRVDVTLRDGSVLSAETAAYRGFHTNPLEWGDAVAKFGRLVTPFTGAWLRDRIVDTLATLEQRRVGELGALLARVPGTRPAESGNAAAGERP
ncbi:2-methylcitrate dehydratase [wastewater metagenome]|uniref:2-methylcitrate dehydratase n=2 Tax=unclassified sequences TaxID=12908 RepID=A0A5B8RK71_9ZZZZ|nr:MmgE/PrpD family protein [Arhodomonas sp. KWT]QEA07277.1 2-methylcitrate dehydratase [uncultured organism]